MARAHLGDEHLMRGRKLFADHAGHAHRRIEARRRGQHVVFHGEDVAQQKFRARLAVAARDADFNQARLCGQPRLRILHELPRDVLFHRRGDERRQHQQRRFKGGQQIAQHRGNRQQRQRQHGVDRDMHRQQPLHALGRDKRLLRLFLRRLPNQQRRRQCLQQKRQSGQPAEPQRRHADSRHRDRRNQRAHGVAPYALDVARKLIAFKLQIMQHPPPGRRARAAQPDRLYDCQKEFHALPSSRKFFAMRRNA